MPEMNSFEVLCNSIDCPAGNKWLVRLKDVPEISHEMHQPSRAALPFAFFDGRQVLGGKRQFFKDIARQG
jgi:hypothetical protein